MPSVSPFDKQSFSQSPSWQCQGHAFSSDRIGMNIFCKKVERQSHGGSSQGLPLLNSSGLGRGSLFPPFLHKAFQILTQSLRLCKHGCWFFSKRQNLGIISWLKHKHNPDHAIPVSQRICSTVAMSATDFYTIPFRVVTTSLG